VKEQNFSAEIDDYIVLKLVLTEYKGSQRSLPPGFEVADANVRSEIRDEEMRLLKLYFRNWRAPYYRRLKGWKDDSPIFVLKGDRLVGGVYLCDKNEFDDDPKWGQLHYAFMDPEYKGLGIYSVIFRTAVKRAQSWGLEGLYLNSDRYVLPEVYERWGAVHWKKIRKKRRGFLWRCVRFCRRIIAALISEFNFD
jgi:GNAT superfamily N-acetyltransferase